jgi:hypothetical protein
MRLFWRFSLGLLVVLLWPGSAPAAIHSVKLTHPGGRLYAPADSTMSFSASVTPASGRRTSLQLWVDPGRPSRTRVCGVTVTVTTTKPITRTCRIDFARFGVGFHTARVLAVEVSSGARVWSNPVLWRKLPANPQLAPPWRGVFYYPWYPEAWGVGTHFTPKLGRYASSNTAVIDRHLDMLRYGRFEVGISSWWSRQHRTNTNLQLLLDRALAKNLNGFRWTIYYECEGNNSTNSPACGRTKDPSVSQLAKDLIYLWARYGHHPKFMRIGHRMVVFVYNADDGPSGDDPGDPCEVLRRWKDAQKQAAIKVHLVMKVFSGYRTCPHQPDGWHQYGPSTGVQTHKDANDNPISHAISPGFWHARDAVPELRRNLYAWVLRVRGMNASPALWKLVTTFNEWGEGTAVEPAREWSSPTGFGHYLDVLHSPR